VGGTLTHFAAPPVLMVAHTWDWDMMFMMKNFGWKSAIGVVINAVAVTALFKKELRSMAPEDESEGGGRAAAPAWLTAVHVLFMGLVVMNAHHMVVFLGIFLFFMGIVDVTIEHQDRLALREALLVGFFLAGLVTLGGFQKWWLQPMISQLDELPLFLGATGLTAITDNAALTYLGSLVEGLQDSDKYALVAGAVAGGGLTVIANAPNPAGYGILKSSFGDEGISPIGLLLGALGPTLVVMACLWWLPSLE
jgi:Na+/H+ antiporter NhaD/arsenite permease-like protein